jgi:hypothetical protein
MAARRVPAALVSSEQMAVHRNRQAAVYLFPTVGMGAPHAAVVTVKAGGVTQSGETTETLRLNESRVVNRYTTEERANGLTDTNTVSEPF